MIHKHSKKKISIVTILLTTFLLLVSSTVVQAAVNPLAKMPTKAGGVLNTGVTGIGWDFMTPEYSSKIKINVKSYNPKIVKVKGYTAQRYQTGKYYAGYETTRVSPGTTKIKVTVTVNAKSYTKYCTYTVYKWENPFKTLKIGSKNYLSKFNKTGLVSLNEDISGKKFIFKLKPEFTLDVTNYAVKGTFSDSTLKSGQYLPENTYRVSIRVKSKKTKQLYTTQIYIPKNYPY